MFELENKKFTIFVKIVIFIIFALIIIAGYFNPTITFKSQTDSEINNVIPNDSVRQSVESYVNVVNVPYNVPTGVSNYFSGTSSLLTINNNDTIVTFNSINNKNLFNIPASILEGIAYTDIINIEGCLNPDQLAVNYIEKTCQNIRCLDSFGNPINNGVVIQNMINRDSINNCTDQNLGYLSFNFALNPLEVSTANPYPGIVNSNTLFMTIKNIYAGTNIYNQLFQNNNLNYFFENNLFIKDVGIGTDDLIPRIVHSNFDSNNFRQKIVIKKFINNNNLAEIIFRPAQLFLNSRKVNNSIQKITTSLSVGKQNGTYINNSSVRTINQQNNSTAKCMIDTNSNIIIISGGQGYNSNFGVSILDDNNQFLGNFNIGTNVNDNQIIFNQRSNFSDEQRAVWLLVPPTDLSPEGITKNNKLTQGYILNFSNQSPIKNINQTVAQNSLPVYNKVAPGTIICPLNVNSNTTSINKFVNLNNFITLDTEIEGRPDSFYENMKAIFAGNIQGGLFQETSIFSINPQIYDTYPDFLLKAINPYPMFANPQSIILNGNIIVLVMQLNNNKGTAAGDIFGYDYELLVGASLNNNSLNYVNSGIILDGAVEWQQIDPFVNTIAFRNDYFNNPSLLTGVSAINSITNITYDNLNFIPPVLGKLTTIDINNVSYANITMPDLYNPVIINLNSTNLVGTGIGENATGVFTFFKIGTSTIIQSAQILDVGSGYTSGTFSINGSAFQSGLSGTVDGITLTSTDDVYTYEAIAMDSSNNPLDISNSNNIDTYNFNYGLIVNPNNNLIINGGQNYRVGMSVYINQYDINNNSVFGISFNQNEISSTNMQKLPYITVKGISSINDNIYFPSFYPLFNNNNNGIFFNLWEDSPGTYTNCPQQIVYYGDFIGISSPYVGDPATDLAAFFYNNKIAETEYTEIEFLSSLQIPSFYYQNTNDDIPGICGYEGLALKRFIPYREFNPPTKTSNTENIPTNPGTSTYVNYNYCQFIPYGIKNVYNQQFNNYDNLPVF